MVTFWFLAGGKDTPNHFKNRRSGYWLWRHVFEARSLSRAAGQGVQLAAFALAVHNVLQTHTRPARAVRRSLQFCCKVREKGSCVVKASSERYTDLNNTAHSLDTLRVDLYSTRWRNELFTLPPEVSG